MAVPAPIVRTDVYANTIRSGILYLQKTLNYRIEEDKEETRYLLYSIDQFKVGPTYPPGFTP